MRYRLDLAGWWHGRLELNPQIDVAAPAVIEREFYVPLPWNKQVEHLRWPSPRTELSGVVRPIQNQNFRDVMRKFNEGRIVYSRDIQALVRSHATASDASAPRAFLVFEGSNYYTQVHLGDEQVGLAHEGGHLAFEYEITAFLARDLCELRVTVDNFRRKDAAPQEQFNWQNYGGIYRPVYIEWRPEVYIERHSAVAGRDDRGWYVDMTVGLSGPCTGSVSATVMPAITGPRLPDLDALSVTGDLRGDGPVRSGRIHFKARPELWRAGSGALHELQILLITDTGWGDELIIPFGLRTVELRGHELLVSGAPIRLLGAAMHEQHPAFGSSLPGWQATRDLQLLKHVGLNAVRAAHYPHAQSFYDACDREGVLALAELPCWQFDEHHFQSEAVRAFCCDYAREMVRQLGHHPSIIGWVIQNESKTFAPGAAEFFRAIHDAFKETDPSRFTISAESPEPPEHLAVVKKVQDGPELPGGALPPTAEFLDVLGVNNYAGWYANKSDYLPKLLDDVHARWGDRPLLVTEFGAEGTPGERSLEMHPWTEDYQSELLCRHIAAILERDWVVGFFIWLFIDYEAASIGIRGINAKGLVDEHRRPKLALNEVKRHLEHWSAGGDVTT